LRLDGGQKAAGNLARAQPGNTVHEIFETLGELLEAG
jgi:hypothetical protein